jgi:hypothetical protein
MLGWKAYFGLAQTACGLARAGRVAAAPVAGHAAQALASRHHDLLALRALGRLGDDARRVAANSHCWWRNSAGDINKVLTIAYFDRLGPASTSHDLKRSNRPVRTRMPGGVGGGRIVLLLIYAKSAQDTIAAHVLRNIVKEL